MTTHQKISELIQKHELELANIKNNRSADMELDDISDNEIDTYYELIQQKASFIKDLKSLISHE